MLYNLLRLARHFRDALALALALAFAPASAHSPAIVGPQDAIFTWINDACERWDIPDAPARAWADAEGIALVAGSERTRVSRGPSLARLVRDCRVVHQGAGNDDPAAHDDRAWIAAVYPFRDGRLEALAHVEYHGHLRPDRCPTGGYRECWQNAVTALVSHDGGRSFQPATSVPVAAPAWEYDGSAGRRTGYFNPSNILRWDDHLYAFVFAERYGAQRRGACLLRRPVEAAADAWRAWDGEGFDATLSGTARAETGDTCAPLPGIASTISSVVRHERTERFLAVTPGRYRDDDGAERSGIWWLVSDDLLEWSRPQLLIERPLLWRRDCAARAAYAYPSLIDESSASAAFDSVGDFLWLTLVEMPLDRECRIGPHRDLIRLPVSWRG